MSASDRLIVALDVPDISSAQKLVDELSDEVIFYKIGLELMMSGSYFELVKWLKKKGKKVFCDLKFYDIPETVARAVANLAQYEIDLLTIHTVVEDVMKRAVEAAHKSKMKILGVTVLTTVNQEDLDRYCETTGFSKMVLEEIVLRKTKRALDCGLDGVISSALEARDLRKNLGNNFLIVSPGIRLEAVQNDDQKRVTDVKTALQNGVSHLVVGRPITRDANPRLAAQKFNNLIASF